MTCSMNYKLAVVAAVPVFFCGMASGQTSGAEMRAAADTSAGRSGDVQFFGGLRVWGMNWETPVLTRAAVFDPANPSAPATKDIEQRYSSTRAAPIPFLGVRYGNFIGSVSYLTRTAYGFNGLPNDIRREEFDATLGYYVIPQLALSVGYKTAKVDRISTLVSGGSTTDVYLVGASSSVPLEGSGRLSLYGNVAYGVGKSRADIPDSNKVDVSYRIGEVGLSYRLFSAPQGALKHLNLSFGYRAQVATLKNIAFGSYATPTSLVPTSVERRNIQSTTDGFVIGLIGVF